MASWSTGWPPQDHDLAGTTGTGTPWPGISGCTGTARKAGKQRPGARISPRWTITATVHSQPASRPARTRPGHGLGGRCRGDKRAEGDGYHGGGRPDGHRDRAVRRRQVPHCPARRPYSRRPRLAPGLGALLGVRAGPVQRTACPVDRPYAVGRPLDLIPRAWDADAAPVLILDGRNGAFGEPCPLAEGAVQDLAEPTLLRGAFPGIGEPVAAAVKRSWLGLDEAGGVNHGDLVVSERRDHARGRALRHGRA